MKLRRCVEEHGRLRAVAEPCEGCVCEVENEQYPAAPKDTLERRAWFGRRNRALQELGARPVNGIDFGRGDRKGK